LVAGTLFGEMIFGLIATLISCSRSRDGAWIVIVGGAPPSPFVASQRFEVGSFRLRRAA
jgi:hypothetical protein